MLAVLTGPVQVLLVAERTLLNLASRASGVATHTRRWADALEGTGALVLDTRKTTPGLRALEKYAVRCGGGTNKRMGLYDVAMVKDNHVVAAGSVAAAVAAVRTRFPDVDDPGRGRHPRPGARGGRRGARFLLLDNMPTPLLAEVVAAVRAVDPAASSSRPPATSRSTAPRGRRRPASTTCRSAGSRTRRRSSTWRSTWSRCSGVTISQRVHGRAGKIAR